MRKFCYIILTTLFLASVVALQAAKPTRKAAKQAGVAAASGKGRGQPAAQAPRGDQQVTPPAATPPPTATPPAAPEEVTLPAINVAAKTAGGIIFGKGAIQGKIENSNPTAVKLSWSWDAVNNKYGVFGIKANEKAIISATLKITDAGKEKIVKKTCTVTVTPELDTSVTFEAIGTTKNITVGEGPITTKNSDNNIVTIGARKGAVYPITSKNPGTADVTFTSATFSEAKKTVTVTVTKHEEVTLPAINFEANTSKGVNFGEGELLGSPKSSDETVARLSAPYIWNKNKNGYGVFGIKAGSAKLGATIKDKNGKIKNVTIPITVTKGTDLSLTFEKIDDTKNILVGQGIVTAKSSPEGVLSIGKLKDGTFPITAKALKAATITFEHTLYGKPYPTTTVTVTA